MVSKPLENRKIAMIIAFRDFRDEEYFITKQTLEIAGAQITIFSRETGIAIGSQGGEAKVNLTLDDLRPERFNAVLFIGGAGAAKLMDNAQAHQIAHETANSEILLGAICIAPTILARAGVLRGREATVWSSGMDKSAVKILKEEGAKYKNEEVVVDGNIITANGPPSARKFAEAVIEKLREK